MLRLIVTAKHIYDKFSEDEMTVYAAQVSFFLILSAVPSVMLLLTVAQMLPNVSNAQILALVVELTPADYKSLAFRFVSDISLKSPATMLSVTAVTALWSAGRGIYSVARGLNRIHGLGDGRPYVVRRLIYSGYTVVFMLVVLLTLGLLVFGRMFQAFMEQHLPLIAPVTGYIIGLRVLWAAAVLLLFFAGIYTFVPERRLSFLRQLPGAALATAGWLAFSLAFSLYFSHFGGRNYSYMYGSLAAIVLFLLWLYGCICILFFGAELNAVREHEQRDY